MLPPILEIYVVWHPQDEEGEAAARQIVDHFHGTSFSGLIGGAVEVFVRSDGWEADGESPRPLPFMEALPHGIPAPELMAVVPVLGDHLAAAVQDRTGSWYQYVNAIREGPAALPGRVGVFPLQISAQAMDGTELGELLQPIQQIGVPSTDDEPESELRCRDLAQGIAQLAGGPMGQRLIVFISHTRHTSAAEQVDARLLDGVRRVIGQTRLDQFFDANDLQPGEDWESHLLREAAHSALLAIRTDLYSTRSWCQREMLTAKRAGMPIVILDALAEGEERGSFLMDHVPRMPGPSRNGSDGDSRLRKALNQLVDECLKRALWRRQEDIAKRDSAVHVSWWAHNAPEPATLADWIEESRHAGNLPEEGPIRILHPDPPLGTDELDVLEQVARLSGLADRVEVWTPRVLAARGG